MFESSSKEILWEGCNSFSDFTTLQKNWLTPTNKF
jgi:hypothetical protein